MNKTLVSEGLCKVSTTRGTKPFDIAYQIHGKGTRRVILIAGRGAKGDGWIVQAVFLARCGFQVCVFDNRGIGKSGRPDTPFTTYDMALDTIELLNHLGWKSDIHLVGISMGGMISQHLLLHYPQYFISCCLTSTSANMKKPNSNTIPTQPTSLPERIIEVSSMFPESWLKAPNSTVPSKTNKEVLTEVISQSHHTDEIGVDMQRKAVLNHVLSDEELTKIRNTNVKILVCTGDKDKHILPSNSEYLAAKLNAPLKIFKGCGHVIYLEEPQQYNETLLAHFNSVTDGNGQVAAP